MTENNNIPEPREGKKLRYRKRVYKFLSNKFSDFKRNESDFYNELDSNPEYASKVYDVIYDNFGDFKKGKDEFVGLMTISKKKEPSTVASRVGGQAGISEVPLGKDKGLGEVTPPKRGFIGPEEYELPKPEEAKAPEEVKITEEVKIPELKVPEVKLPETQLQQQVAEEKPKRTSRIVLEQKDISPFLSFGPSFPLTDRPLPEGSRTIYNFKDNPDAIASESQKYGVKPESLSQVLKDVSADSDDNKIIEAAKVYQYAPSLYKKTIASASWAASIRNGLLQEVKEGEISKEDADNIYNIAAKGKNFSYDPVSKQDVDLNYDEAKSRVLGNAELIKRTVKNPEEQKKALEDLKTDQAGFVLYRYGTSQENQQKWKSINGDLLVGAGLDVLKMTDPDRASEIEKVFSNPDSTLAQKVPYFNDLRNIGYSALQSEVIEKINARNYYDPQQEDPTTSKALDNLYKWYNYLDKKAKEDYSAKYGTQIQEEAKTLEEKAKQERANAPILNKAFRGFSDIASGLSRGAAGTFVNTVDGFATLIKNANLFVPGADPTKLTNFLAKKYEGNIDELFPQTPEFKNSIADQLSQALGQVAAMVLAARAGGGGGRAAAGLGEAIPQTVVKAGATTQAAVSAAAKQLVSGLSNPASVVGALNVGQQEYRRAKEAGASDEQAFEAFVKNGVGGSVLEQIPVMKFFERLNKATSGGVLNYIKTKAVGGITGGIEEMTTEVLQQLYANKTAKDIYNINQDLFEGVTSSGGIGFGAGFILNAMGQRANILRKEGKVKEAQSIEDTVGKIEQRLNIDAQKERDDLAKQGVVLEKAEVTPTAPKEETLTDQVARQIEEQEKAAQAVGEVAPEAAPEVPEAPVERLEKEYRGKTVEELAALKKQLYPSPDIETPMSAEEKLLDRVIADKFSEINQSIVAKRKAAEESPRFTSYDDAQKWIEDTSKKYKSKNEFLASQEYKDALPDINALYKVEKADYSKKAKDAMDESGVKIGDRVIYDYVTPFGAETYSGKIVERDGIPFVRFDEGQKTMSGKQSVRWHKGFVKEAAAEAKPELPAAKIEKPKVVITGTRNGLENLSSNNYDIKTDAKIKDARGREGQFENGVLIEDDGKGNTIINIKTDAVDSFGRRGFLQASVIVPKGTEVNPERIKSVVEEEVKKLRNQYNTLELGQVQQADLVKLKDAVVRELQGAGEVVTEAAPQVPAATPEDLYRTLKNVGENTPDKNLLATSSGLIIHAGDTKIDKIDLSKVKGGARGIYGKGIYFTDSPYKAADYGGKFTYLDKSKLSIIDTKEAINQDFVKSIKDVAKKFERAGNIEKSFAYNLFADKLQAEINGERSIDDAWKNVRDRFAVDKTNTWNALLKDLGYDTIKNGYEYVVFDADKGNAALVKDANTYISEAYYKGDNPKLTKEVNELFGVREVPTETIPEVPAAPVKISKEVEPFIKIAPNEYSDGTETKYIVPTSNSELGGYIEVSKEVYDEWKKLDEEEKIAVRSSQRILIPEQRSKSVKGDYIRYAAEKRKVLGTITSKELASQTEKQSKLAVGDTAKINGTEYTISGFPFGRIKLKIKSESGTEEITVSRGSEIEKKILAQKPKIEVKEKGALFQNIDEYLSGLSKAKEAEAAPQVPATDKRAQARKSLKDAFDDLMNLGIIYDPRSQAEKQVRLTKAIINVIKEEAIGAIKDLKKYIKENLGFDISDNDAKYLLLESKKPEYAIQEPTAGEVPVQPEARAGEKVEAGVPPTEPPKTPEEGKAEGEEKRLSGIKKGLVSQEILGSVNFEKTGDKELLEKGRQIIESGEVNPRTTVDRIVDEGRGVLSPAEVVALIYYKADLDTKVEDLTSEMERMKAAGEDLGEMGVQLKDLEVQQRNFDIAAVITAQQQSMSFRLRRWMLDRTYSLQQRINNYKKVNNGTIPENVQKKFEELDKELQSLKKQIRDAEIRKADEDAQVAVDNIVEDVNREDARQQLTEKEIEQRVQKGVEAEINRIYEQLPSKKKSRAEQAIAALDRIQARLRNKTYDAGLGIPVAFIDAGITTIKRALKAGIAIEKAVQLGIDTIKEKLKGKPFDNENVFRQDLLDGFKAEGIKTEKEISETLSVNEDGSLNIPESFLRDLVRSGKTSIEQLTDAVFKELEPQLPGLTKRQIRDSITQYGKTINPTKDDVRSQLGAAKRIGRLLSEVEDLKNMSPSAFFLKYGKNKSKNIPEKERLLKEEVRNLMRSIKADPSLIPLKDAENLSRAKENAKRRIQELQDRLKKGDYSKKPKPTVKADAELEILNTKKEKLQEQFEEETKLAEVRNRTFGEKAKDFIIELLSSLPRAFVAGFDLSAAFVQGTWRVFTSPIMSAKAFAEGLKQFASPKRAEQFMNRYKSTYDYVIARNSKLAITSPEVKISENEQFFVLRYANLIYDTIANIVTLGYKPAANFLKAINPLKASQRAFEGYVNYIRISTFKKMSDSLRNDGYNPEYNPKVFKSAADFVNTTTGRASLGGLETSSKWLGTVFFAARKVAAELKLFTPYAFFYYAKMPATIRKRALMDFAKFATSVLATHVALRAALEALGEEQEDDFWNPKSSNFMSFKIGEKRLSVLGGAKSTIVFMSRILFGNTFVDKYGEETKFGERAGKKINTKFDLITRFVAGKFAPVAAAFRDYMDRNPNYENDDEIYKSLVTPIWIQDLNELYKDDPIAVTGMFNLLSIVGANITKVDFSEVQDQITFTEKIPGGFTKITVGGDTVYKKGRSSEVKRIVKLTDAQKEEFQNLTDERFKVEMDKIAKLVKEASNLSTRAKYTKIAAQKAKEYAQKILEEKYKDQFRQFPIKEKVEDKSEEVKKALEEQKKKKTIIF